MSMVISANTNANDFDGIITMASAHLENIVTILPDYPQAGAVAKECVGFLGLNLSHCFPNSTVVSNESMQRFFDFIEAIDEFDRFVEQFLDLPRDKEHEMWFLNEYTCMLQLTQWKALNDFTRDEIAFIRTIIKRLQNEDWHCGSLVYNLNKIDDYLSECSYYEFLNIRKHFVLEEQVDFLAESKAPPYLLRMFWDECIMNLNCKKSTDEHTKKAVQEAIAKLGIENIGDDLSSEADRISAMLRFLEILQTDILIASNVKSYSIKAVHAPYAAIDKGLSLLLRRPQAEFVCTHTDQVINQIKRASINNPRVAMQMKNLFCLAEVLQKQNQLLRSPLQVVTYE